MPVPADKVREEIGYPFHASGEFSTYIDHFSNATDASHSANMSVIASLGQDVMQVTRQLSDDLADTGQQLDQLSLFWRDLPDDIERYLPVMARSVHRPSDPSLPVLISPARLNMLAAAWQDIDRRSRAACRSIRASSDLLSHSALDSWHLGITPSVSSRDAGYVDSASPGMSRSASLGHTLSAVSR